MDSWRDLQLYPMKYMFPSLCHIIRSSQCARFFQGEMLMNKPYEWYGKWYICKFQWNCIFEVWIKKNLGMFSFKKSNTLSSMQCEVTDRQMDVRQTWKTPSILVTWLDIKYHYYNCWSLHALGKPKYMQKRKHLLITMLPCFIA